MQIRGYWKPVLALVAAIAMALVSLDTLPQYPDKVAWPRAVSWLAFSSGVVTLFLWFNTIAWLVERVTGYGALVRAVLLLSIVLLGSAAFVAPLLLAMLFLGVCRVAVECENNAQGYFSVLSVFARHLSIGGSLITSLLLVAVAATVAHQLHNFAKPSTGGPDLGASDA